MSRTNERLLWTVVGVLLVALGGAGIAASFGHLPGTHAHSPLLWSGLLDLWRDIRPWSLVVTIALGLLLALLGAALLSRITRPQRRARLDELTLHDGGAPTHIDGGAPSPDLPGRTRIRASVLARVLERDLTRDPEVRQASVVLTGAAPRPELRIDLRVDPRARLAAVRDRVGAAVERFCTTSGLRPRHLDVTARIDRAGYSRVR
jgi:hypothetical protein